MREEEIEKRRDEIRADLDKLYREDVDLKSKLDEFSNDRFKNFIVGKKFKVPLSDDYRRLRIINSQFSIRDILITLK